MENEVQRLVRQWMLFSEDSKLIDEVWRKQRLMAHRDIALISSERKVEIMGYREVGPFHPTDKDGKENENQIAGFVEVQYIYGN